MEQIHQMVTQLIGMVSNLHSEMKSFKCEMKDEMGNFRRDMKDEMESFKSDMKDEMVGFKNDIKVEIADFKAQTQPDIHYLKSEMADMRFDVKCMRKEMLQVNHRLDGHSLQISRNAEAVSILQAQQRDR